MKTIVCLMLLVAVQLACFAETPARQPKPAEVILASGATITGLVTEWPANIFFDNGSLPMTYSKDQVKAIRYLVGDEATQLVQEIEKHRAETNALPARQETDGERKIREQRQVQRAVDLQERAEVAKEQARARRQQVEAEKERRRVERVQLQAEDEARQAEQVRREEAAQHAADLKVRQEREAQLRELALVSEIQRNQAMEQTARQQQQAAWQQQQTAWQQQRDALWRPLAPYQPAQPRGYTYRWDGTRWVQEPYNGGIVIRHGP